MQIALIQFHEVGKKYYFSVDNNLNIAVNDVVVVETSVGLETGIVSALKEETEVEVVKTLKPILRKANEKDLKDKASNDQDQIDVVKATNKLVKELDLNMKILEAEYTLDRMKLTIYFESEERVDFRELVRRLSGQFQTRIELRQVGARDVAKRIGGIGPCGLVLCCSTFIGDFDPVTIRMAKNQNLTLNPKKISGICGKLLCCLKYEDSIYSEMREVMPDLYDKIDTINGKATVIDLNFVSSKLKVKYQDPELSAEWINLAELDF